MSDKPEEGAAPIAQADVKQTPQDDEINDCAFICFSIAPDIYNPDYFIVSSSFLQNISFKVSRFDNLTVLRVFCESGIFNKAFQFFSSKFSFKIDYKTKDGVAIFSCNNDFFIEKTKVKFIYDVANKGDITSKSFNNPSGLEQYEAFSKAFKNQDILFLETENFLKETFDIELFLYLLKNNENKSHSLFKILDNYPYFKIVYNKKKENPLQKINFESFSKIKNYNKLIIIYSVIQDSIDLLNEFKEDDLDIFFQYNEVQKDSPILIKKNIFNFFVGKTNDINNVKKICRSCESVPLLFEYIIGFSSAINKINNITINDIPQNISLKDNLIELIEKHERIRDIFKKDEIIKLWRKYLILCYQKNNINELEEIKEKFYSINKDLYEILINEINMEIINKGKKLINSKTLKGLEMFKFINKYNSIDNFFSDDGLLTSIGRNCDLFELDKGGETLKEFNECKFFNKINQTKIENYITGSLVNVKNFDDFFLYFKYIYQLREKEEEIDKKDALSSYLIISHFRFFLNKYSNIKITDNFKKIVQTIILLSLMYIEDKKPNNYINLINDLGNCNSFSQEELFSLFIEIIINPNLEKYISNDRKNVICEYIIENYYKELNIEKKIIFLLKINSLEFKEKYIFKYFPKLNFEDFLNLEETDSFKYLSNFIDKKIFDNKELLNSSYFKDLISSCNSIKNVLEKKEINYSIVNILNEFKNKNKLKNRIKCLCQGDLEKSSEFEKKIKEYVEKYIDYYSQLNFIITYYNKYYPKSKKQEIDKYTQQQLIFKEAKTNISEIELNEKINEEVKEFDKYENSKFFGIFYNNIDKLNIDEEKKEEDNEEDYKFKKAIETFNQLEKLFNGNELNLDFLDIPLNKIEDNLLYEIKYLKNHFGYKDSDEKKIFEELIFYKNRKNISSALNSLKFICEIFEVENTDKFYDEILKIIEKIEKITEFSEISGIIKSLKKIDENILEKNFIEVLNLLYNGDDELISFLNLQKESETRDLIDGLFDNDNDESVTIELKDIEILINVVCFIQELKSKTKNINVFLINFHSLLDNNNETSEKFREIASNIAHIENKLSQLQDYIKLQLGRKYKYSANLEKFLEEGIIEFDKIKQKPVNDLMSLYVNKENKEEMFYEAIIRIGNKVEFFQTFIETIRKIKAKNIYKYGKNRDIFLKAQKIAQLIQQILKELNLNVKQEFKEVYKVSSFEFINKGILKLPQLEKVLDDLRKKNYKIRTESLKKLDANPAMQFLLNLDLYDFDEINNQKKIESYFPNIHELEDKEDSKKIIHKNFKCDGCGVMPIIGIRYNCKTCKNFDYCENCMEKNKETHKHEFTKVETPVEFDGIPPFLQFFFIATEIKYELNYLKGIFFYKTSKSEYELDILKICNKLMFKFPPDFKLPISFSKNLPLHFNLLLCHDEIKETQIYSFCVRAVNCITNNLFIIVRPEELKIGEERYFFKTFNKFLERKNFKLSSCIVILYINQNSHIIKQLKKLKEKYDFPDEPPLFQTIEDSPIENLEDLPIEVVTSDSPRVGKTTHIYRQIGKEGYMVTFPLGDIDLWFLTVRTDSLNDLKGKVLSIIFELYENPDEKTYELIRNFLFQFLILKTYRTYTYVADIKVKVFIEVSSDYTTFDEDFKILKLFKRTHIQLKNNPDFYEKYKIVPTTVSNLLDVLNYLKLLKNGQINNTIMSLNTYGDILKGNLKSLDEEFDQLIKEFFIQRFPSKKFLPNYGQIEMFGDLLGNLIFNFENCLDMDPKTLKENSIKIPSLINIREKIVLSYLEFVIKFSSLTYESILENQEIASKNQKMIGYKLSNELKKKLIDQLNTKRVISYNEIKPSIVLFNTIPTGDQYLDLNKCSIITTYKDEEKQYKMLNDLYDKYFKLGTLFNLSEFGGPQFIFELRNICLTPQSEVKYIKEKLENYEFTMDNFVKMVLIYLRIRAGIPLILLGETGCGKTSLIESLVCFLRGRYRLITFNIHSGLTYVEIVNFLKANKLMAKPSFLDEFEKMLNLQKNEKKNEKERIILFLDEINTTNSLNLICDMFTKHSFIGNRLADNVYVIGACNPYRLMLSKDEEIGYRNKKMHNVRNLVYTVNPLPLCLINYVFDFGNLREEDENKYIHKFVDSFLNTRFSKSNNLNYTKILEIICEAVYFCQKYIRINSEISSVSLREIKRFRIFFEFFLNITKERNEFKKNDFSFVDPSIFVDGLGNFEKTENIIILKAANLSLFMCYYLRIINVKKRQELSSEVSKILKFNFLDYPLKLENELANSITLEKGIAKNRALLDNLFALFVCLNNKIPVFICGKAGCSKSLSFSLLFQSMKGEYSKSELFKKYPSLYVTSYQGSLTSSSYEIKTIFERAKKIVNLEKKKLEEEMKKTINSKKSLKRKKNGNLSVILFDEMGLAEISPYNPLKVIHSELDGKQEVGFVGISNWSLDASKMNRGIHISVQEPDLDDLILTANTIASGIYEEIQNIEPFKKIIENLTKSYYDYKEHLKQLYVLNYDFHGARDFYYLIKITARLLKNNVKTKSLESIAMESIERNFGGLELDKEDKNNIWSSTKKFKKIFSNYQNNYVENVDKYDIFSCIKNNLEEDNNRYLLLITRKTKNDALIEFILKKLKLNYRFIQGSKLKEDQNENYVLQKAWSIISSMENGEIIILKDMEIVYPKFYDLFNQNLQKFGNSRYARIVLDSTTNERHLVNKGFRCIILLEQKEVKEQDPPFLNRFEKHLMSFKYLLTEKQNHLAKEIFEEIRDLTTIPENKKFLPLLVNINLEEIRCLLLDLSMKFENIDNNILCLVFAPIVIVEIFKLLIPTFTQKIFLNSLFSPQKKYINKEDIIKIYEENTHTNIFKFLEKVQKNKLMVYTFSPYYKDIFSENNNLQFENPKFGVISKENTVEITFNQKLSEKMLNYFFQLYYEQVKCNLFIIHFRVKDTKFLKYIKFQLDSFLKENKENQKKIFLFIIHIEKNYDIEKKEEDEENENKSVEFLEKYHSYFFSFLSEYQQITIDNLLEQRDISVINLFNKSNEELLLIKELFDINSIIKKEFSRQITQMATNQEMNSIIDKLDNLNDNGILDCIIKKIQGSIKNSDNILRKILVNYTLLLEKDFDFISYFIEKIELLISDNVEKLIKELGKSGYLVSYLFEKEIPKKLKEPITSFINNINLIKNISDDNLENYSLDLKIPGSRLLIKKLSNLVKNCKIEYLNKEDEYRKGSKKKEDKKKKKRTLEDVHFEKKQYLKSRLWNEELLTDEIFSEYSQEILKDFLTFYFYDPNKKKSINKQQEEFLLFLYSKKNVNDNLLDRFLYFFLWIGSYHETIVKLLDIFNKLGKYFNSDEKEQEEKKDEDNLGLTKKPSLEHAKESLLDSLKDNYDIFNLPPEKEKERETEKEKVNGIFYRVSESICHIITNIHNVDIKTINLKVFCTDLNEVAQIFTQFNSTLSLGLKGQFSLISIAKIIEYSQKKNLNEEEFKPKLNSFIKNIFDERCYLLKKNISQAKKSFNEQLNIVLNLSDELCMKIFVNKLLQYSKLENYKLELVKTIFEFPQLVKYSSLFFNYIFLTLPIKPKRQTKKNLSDDDKKEFLKKFGEIKNQNKNEILLEINKQAENNEILKEIILYIFELRIISYFEDCLNTKYIKEAPSLLLTGLNFDYLKRACNDINTNDFGKLKYLGEIFCFSFIRCYLYHFVKLQLKKKDLGDLSPIHSEFVNISNSELGKMIILYIANIFIINNKKEDFMNKYLKDEKTEINWKVAITEKNDKLEFFSICDYENSKHLLFKIWSSINNNEFDENFISNINIIDLYQTINFAYNEINHKSKENLERSILLLKLNELKDNFNFDEEINDKIKKLISKIYDIEFFKEESLKPHLKLIFNMIRLYILGFVGSKNNLLFSLIYSDNISNLIKIFYSENLKEEIKFIESYYKMKKYLKEEYVNKQIYYPAYVCSCGRWYTIKDSLPVELKDCPCGQKIGGKNEVLEERENHMAIYYDENQKNYIESGRANKIANKNTLKGKLLQDYKKQFIEVPISNKCQNLKNLLIENNEIDDKTFSKEFIKFVFLSQIFIEYKIGIMTENEKNNEFNETNLLEVLINLNKNIEEFLDKKQKNYHDFMNYFCDYYLNLLKNNYFL